MIVKFDGLCFQIARSFQLEVKVDPKYHPKIIGRKGAVISKIRTDHNVNIQFPNRGSECDDVITITGYERDTEAARDDILGIVRELVSNLFAFDQGQLTLKTSDRVMSSSGWLLRKRYAHTLVGVS